MGLFVLSRTIVDSLHGIVNLTDEEMAVIDHSLFQRMKHIRQTGLLHLVFPSAVHTRFEHSVGTMAMANRILKAVNRESVKIRGKLYALRDAKPGQAVCLADLPPAEYAQIRRVLRLCALVHDLGHGPLSHNFDAFAPSVKDVDRVLDDPRLKAIAPYRNVLIASKSGRVHHETVSVIMFACIWNDVGGDEWMPRVVASVLLGEDALNVPEELRPWIPFIRDMVSSAPVDADRMDYLLRDSRATGVTCGHYDQHRILKSALCVRDADGADCYRLGWRESGLSAIETFIWGRFQMFRGFYFNKTNRAAELMLQTIGEEATRQGLTPVNMESLDSFTESYLFLGDEMFLGLLTGTLRPGFPANERISELARLIQERKLWKRVWAFKARETWLCGPLLEGLQKQYPEIHFIMDRRPLRAMKDIEKGSYLVGFDAESKYSCSTAESTWFQESAIMCTLRDQEASMVRLYMEVPRSPLVPTRTVRESAIRLANDLIHAKND
ncbi:MAG: hypothetical protein WC802_02555 [Patescibacteria group bacterium]|jgi:hypothetical protein